MEQAADKIRRWKSAAAIATVIAIPAEGLRQYAYYDPPGILTVCYGSTSQVEKGKKYSLEECRARLDDDMLDAIRTVDRCVPGLPDNVLAAFGDAVYNVGPRIACDRQRSTAARKLAAGDIEGACKELPKWSRATVGGTSIQLPGLVKRRRAEMNLCLGGENQ